jgi:hypothetical protein
MDDQTALSQCVQMLGCHDDRFIAHRLNRTTIWVNRVDKVYHRCHPEVCRAMKHGKLTLQAAEMLAELNELKQLEVLNHTIQQIIGGF